MVDFPKRVRVLILGGGIHGVGLLHDLASRGWKDVCLLERKKLSSGTSSRSTKLIHGGLRYLKQIRDFPLVSEALKERQVLHRLAPDLVKPLELYLPVLKNSGMSSLVLKAGLSLYDFLAGSQNIHKHRVIKNMQEIEQNVPCLDLSEVKKVFSFWDMQMDDAELVYRVADSAKMLGAQLFEHCEAISCESSEDGWLVQFRDKDGSQHSVSALYVFNALGPWAHDIFLNSTIKPLYKGANSKGVHLVIPDVGHKTGLFLQSPEDDRIFFMLPWQGKTLIGTTEDRFEAHPDSLTVTDSDINYLLERCNRYLKKKISRKDILNCFAGMRWLQADIHGDLGSTTRAYTISEHKSGRGVLFTLYGGKYTTYRNLSKMIGDKILGYFGDFEESRTHLQECWINPGTKNLESHANQDILHRFSKDGIAFTPVETGLEV